MPTPAARPGTVGRCDTGYTLIELITVVSVLGILAAVAAPRFFARTAFDERTYRDELASALRYGQKVAVPTGCPVRVTLTAGNYALGQQGVAAGHCDPSDTAYATPVRLADGQTASGVAPPGLSATPALTFDFGADGQTSLGADRTVSVGARSLTIDARSGLVTTP